MKIFIDAGHNDSGYDTGAQGNGIREQDITYGISKKLSEKLQGAGFELKESRPEKGTILGYSETSSLQKRCDMANQWNADYFISIHCNAASASAKGTETYIVGRGGQAEQLAEKVQGAIVNRLGTTDRGVKTANYKVLSGTSMPAILVETAFITNTEDAGKLKNRQEDFAESIFQGICEHTGVEKEETNVAGQTVMQLQNVWVQEIDPKTFGAYISDAPKRERKCGNYFNLGFFAQGENGKTITIGNFADCGHVFSQAKDNADWINVAKKQLSTLIVTTLGEAYITKTDTLTTVKDLKTAISGIPILQSGTPVNMETIKSEGYFGNELYDTWHGFLGLRGDSIVYVAAQCDFGQMPWILLSLGIRDAIKVDGGGSFILVNNGVELIGTPENRRINNIGMWE